MIDSVELVRSLYEAFKRGDLGMIFAACEPDIEWTSNASAELIPWGGSRTGIQEAKQFFAEISEHVEFETFEPRRFFWGYDSVTVLGWTAARFKPTGGHFAGEWLHLFGISPDGKVKMFREFYDTHALVAAYQGG
jgi:ketosteroid isomerase-like protein